LVGQAIHVLVAGLRANPGLQIAQVVVERIAQVISHGSAIQQFVSVVATATHVVPVVATVIVAETKPVAQAP